MRVAVAPLIAAAYHSTYTRDPELVRKLPNGDAWLASVQALPEHLRHLSVHRGHNLDITNTHDALIDTSRAKQMTVSGSRAELPARLQQLESAGATGVSFGSSGADVVRELHAFASMVGLVERS